MISEKGMEVVGGPEVKVPACRFAIGRATFPGLVGGKWGAYTVFMTQEERREKLQAACAATGRTFADDGESQGYRFALVDGATVLITRTKNRNPRGGYLVPAVHTYPEKVDPTNLDAAIRAMELFQMQTPLPDSD